MAINKFAVVTDGFGKPATVSGTDWANKIPRALLITCGYLNFVSSAMKITKKSKWIYWMNFYYGKR